VGLKRKVHVCNPSYSGDRDRRIMVQGQPRQKVSKTPSQKTNWTWWNTAAISVMKEDQGLKPAPDKKPQDPTE
jgi:hypothetical protein